MKKGFDLSHQRKAEKLHKQMLIDGQIVGGVPRPDLYRFPMAIKPKHGISISLYYNTGQYVIGARQIAKLIGRSSEFIRKKAAKGELPHIRMGKPNRIIVVEKDQFIGWVTLNKERLVENEYNQSRIS